MSHSQDNLKPEERARKRIDSFLEAAGWTIVPRDEFTPIYPTAVTEALMLGNKESDYLLFIDGKAIAVLEAKREENELKEDVESQAENYAHTPQKWYGLWKNDIIPLVYMSNGTKILYKNLLTDNEYTEIDKMHSPKEMLRLIGENSEYGALPKLHKGTLRDCQFLAENKLEENLRNNKKRNLAVLATGSGKTYLACLSSYRLLNYTPVNRVLFLADRNNLARQAESEFSQFSLTDNQMELSSLYLIKRLKKEEDIKATIVISTIQKLYAVMTGQQLSDDNEDAEDENNAENEEKDTGEDVQLGDNIRLASDHFDLIIVDECHRSIYGKWKAVLDYFKGAVILGLTATPTPEAEAFFNGNYVERYTIEKSEDDGVNVPPRIYRIMTQITEHGGSIKAGTTVKETARRTGDSKVYTAKRQVEYASDTLDRSVINREQIIEVLINFKNAIYKDLYPERRLSWDSIPKTLIFAKDDRHATEIVDAVEEVFKNEFPEEILPEGFVQKITYSAGDSNALIRDFRTEKEFRIAVTVTLVATGTDIKPLEIVIFMKDVQSDVLYTQMKGRGCRTIDDDKLKEVTPNADYKECYYIIDAVGVTEHEKKIPRVGHGQGDNKKLTLPELLEHLAHKELSDDNLMLLRDYCATIHNRYEYNQLFGYHLTEFIDSYGFSPRDLSTSIRDAFDNDQLPPFISPSDDNTIRWQLIARLMNSIPAKKKLLELHKGYFIVTEEDPDTLIYAGFSVETAKGYIDNFEKYITEHKDEIEALRIIYNADDTPITNSMLEELREKLLLEDRHFSAEHLWKYYHTLNANAVDELDDRTNAKLLTNLIQLVRYAYGKSQKLTSLMNSFAQRFNLYCGQTQRDLSEEQVNVMRTIAEYIISEGAVSAIELNQTDADLWRRGMNAFGRNAGILNEEMNALSRILLKVA